MIHLGPLPGSPGFAGSIEAVVEDGVKRAITLTDSGFPSLMIENFGDIPFYADDVPAVTAAAMTRCVAAIAAAVAVPLGVNVLRNDAVAAVAIASVTGAAMVRVNVLTGSMETDQGPIVGRAARVIRDRQALSPDTEVWADVLVKHANPPPGLTLEQAAADTWHRGGADALIVSGSGTGHAPDLDAVARVRQAVPDAPLVVGSGATAENLGALWEHANHVIVGTALERDGRPGAALDADRIGTFTAAAAALGLW